MNKGAPLYVVTFMTAVCLIFGSGVAVVYRVASPVLEKNEALHRNKVVCLAFDLGVTGNNPDLYVRAIGESLTVATNESYVKNNTGDIGFVFSGTGFWDAITGILVVSPDTTTIRNIAFLDQKETPGLGARIEEPAFTDQFRGRKIAWDKEEAQRIIIGPSPDPNAQNRVDAITGASQTSLALMITLNKELERFRNTVDTRTYGRNP